jgi:hypothetical protein
MKTMYHNPRIWEIAKRLQTNDTAKAWLRTYGLVCHPQAGSSAQEFAEHAASRGHTLPDYETSCQYFNMRTVSYELYEKLYYYWAAVNLVVRWFDERLKQWKGVPGELDAVVEEATRQLTESCSFTASEFASLD